jgi:quercetin dioxygenase-like cupin family protein
MDSPVAPTAIRGVVIDGSKVSVEGWSQSERGAVTWRTLISGERTPTDRLTLGVADVEPEPEGAVILHRHAQAEAYYVLSGEGVVSIDGAEHPLSPGAAVFIPGGALHAARATGSETLKLLWVFAADAFEQVIYEFPGDGDAALRSE